MAAKAKIKLIGIEQTQKRFIELPISKSLSNRALVLSYLNKNNIDDLAISTANDSQLLKNILKNELVESEINVEDAGTVARFTLALCAVDDKTRLIYGTERMNQRPMVPLINALTQLGARVECLNKEGFLPVKITGTLAPSNHVEIDSKNSSQFLSALLLIAPKLPDPFTIELSSEIASNPSVDMTIKCLKQFGFDIRESQKSIVISKIDELKLNKQKLEEGDWSAAIYPLLINRLINANNHTETKEQTEITITNLVKNSYQGDSIVNTILSKLGLELSYHKNGLGVTQISSVDSCIEMNLSKNPDLAQPIICYLAANKYLGNISGLHTLKYKETNRLLALKKELEKIGAVIEIDDDSLNILGYETGLEKGVFKTYNDHRMAMSLAFLQITHPEFEIENPNVVNKSFPNYWEILKSMGLQYQLTTD